MDIKDLQNAAKIKLLRQQQVVAVTTTGLGMYRSMIEGAKPRILVLEEAAEMLEAHILSALTPTIEHCVLIGDHKQYVPNCCFWTQLLFLVVVLLNPCVCMSL